MAAAQLKPRINMITLGVADVARAKAFYERLGFVPSSMGNEDVGFYEANGIVLELFGHHALAEDAKIKSHAPPAFRGVSLAWNNNSEAEVDAVLLHAVACGATLTKAAGKVFWGGYSGYFADPDGHLWEVAFNPFALLDDAGHMQLP